MKHWMMLLGIIGVLVVAAILIPSNPLTGNVVREGSCEEYGCTELCDQEGPNTCGGGKVCCQTHWESGVCEYRTSCEQIREYSLYQSMESYQDSIRERPAPVNADWRSFFLPLLVCVGIVLYFVFKREPDR